MPDMLLIEERFPPSASTIGAILGAGFHFHSLAPHGANDYWFMRDLPADAIGPQRHATLHLVDRANPVGRVMIRVRDTCNTDPAAFEEYKVRHCDSDPTFIPKKYSPFPFTTQPTYTVTQIPPSFRKNTLHAHLPPNRPTI